MGWCNKLLHENLTEAAKRFPDNLAYKLHDDRLTYRQLDRESNKLAQLLISIGVTKGDRIGVFQHKTNWSAVSVYGILKSGCTFVPIDPGSPPDRFGFT